MTLTINKEDHFTAYLRTSTFLTHSYSLPQVVSLSHQYFIEEERNNKNVITRWQYDYDFIIHNQLCVF